MNNEWIYSNRHLLELQGEVLPIDLPDWDFEFNFYDFQDYVRHSMLGTRRYLLQEPDETLPQARRHWKK